MLLANTARGGRTMSHAPPPPPSRGHGFAGRSGRSDAPSGRGTGSSRGSFGNVGAGARTASATRAVPASGPGVHRVFVRRVSYEADAESLSEAMSEFGDVIDVWLAPNVDPSKARAGTKGHRGFGKVAFSTFEAAARAVSHGQIRVLGKSISVEHYEAKEGDASQAGSEKRTALFNRLRSDEHLDASEVERCLKELAPLHSVKEYSMAITARGRAGQWKEALDLLEDMKFKGHPPNAIAYNVAITALERAHKPKKAFALLREMEAAGIQPTVVTYNSLISACAKGEQAQWALDLLREMAAKGLTPDVKSYSAAVSACARGGEGKEAQRLLQEMTARGVPPNEVTYTSVMAACESGDEALAVLRQMSASGMTPDRVSYNRVLAACAKSRQWQMLDELFEEMASHGLQPDVTSYNATITACARAEEPQWARALALLRQMKPRGVEPNQMSFSAAISACSNSQQHREAAALLDEMVSVHGIEPDVVCFSAAISACEKVEDWDLAAMLLSKLRSNGLKPDAIVYNVSILLHSRREEWQQAIEMLREMARSGFEVRAVGGALGWEGKRVWKGGGLVTRGLRLRRASHRPPLACGAQPDTIDYSVIVTTCAKADAWQRALEFFDEMQRKGLEPDVIARNSAISACAKGKDWRKALQILRQMRPDGIEPNQVSYTAAISACEQARQWQEAVALLSEMKACGGPITPEAASFNVTMQAVAAAGQLDTGFRLLEDAYALGLADDSYLMHRKLQDACRTAGDNARAAVLQAAIERLGLTSKKAEASAVIGGKSNKYTCGVAHTGPALECALQALLGRMARTEYVPQARAANFAFVRDSSEAQLANSLAHHAEKLALADLVCHECDALDISVSIKARHASAPRPCRTPLGPGTPQRAACSADVRGLPRLHEARFSAAREAGARQGASGDARLRGGALLVRRPVAMGGAQAEPHRPGSTGPAEFGCGRGSAYRVLGIACGRGRGQC